MMPFTPALSICVIDALSLTVQVTTLYPADFSEATSSVSDAAGVSPGCGLLPRA
ncbi:hypothetical protein D3C72_2178430 [compost metagenome]